MRQPISAALVISAITFGAIYLVRGPLSLAEDGQPASAATTRVVAQQDQKAKKSEPKGKSPLKTAALAKFMRAKLGATQLVLEGLTVEDFDMIAKGAKELSALSKAEQWRVSEDPLYANHSAEFVRVAKKLQQQAEEKNLDGAALNYVQLTMTCIECHRFTRTVLLAGDLRLPGARERSVARTAPPFEAN